jgi:hypothetical protein
VYFLFGTSYGHGPAPYHFVSFIFLIGGVLWFLYSVFKVFKKSEYHKGVVIINFIVIVSSLIWVASL